MPAGVENLTPLVEGAAVFSVHDKKNLLQAKSAFLYDRVISWGPVNQLPLNLVVHPSVL